MARRVSATVAKNQLGKIMRMAESEPVYIVKHGKPQTVVLAADAYEALLTRARDPEDRRLADLRADFDAMYESMQSPGWRRGIDLLLAASAGELNRVAARKPRKARG
jgi:prevent-host-death family protein